MLDSLAKARRAQAAWKRLSLARQLFLAMFTSVVATTSIFFAYDIMSASRRLADMERSTMEAAFPLIQRIIEHAMVHKSPQQIRDLFAATSGHGVAEAMYLLDDTKHAVNIEDLAQGRKPRHFTAPEVAGRTHLIVDFPMLSQPSCVKCHSAAKPVLGYIRLVSPHTAKARMLAVHFKSHLVVVCAMTLLLGLWALLIVRAMVERPLARIAQAMKQVRSGHLDTRIAEVPDSEFGRISAGFNAMVGELERDRGEIIELHRKQVGHLERLVAVGEVAAHLAHEIRNPLTGISTAIQVLQADFAPGTPRRDVLDKILVQLARMDRTMGNFLRYARLPQAEVRPYDLGEALQRTLFLVEPRLNAQRIVLRREIAAGLPRLVGDPGQIEQVLLNLCLNAIQAMPSGGRLTVSAQKKGPDVHVEIADEGCGIPPELLERIFQPFFTTRDNGSGLGLPISRQIVGAHGGELWLESVPGRGTTAHIRLSIQRGAA